MKIGYLLVTIINNQTQIMSFLKYLPVIKNVFSQVQKKNKENPEEKTAAPQVFDRVEKKIGEVDFDNVSSDDQAVLIEMLRKKIEEARIENEAAPEEETAEVSVFDQLNKQMQEVFNSESNQVGAGRVYRGSSPSHTSSTNNDRYSSSPEPSMDPQRPTKPMPGSTALIESGGGSLALRVSPDMGAAQLSDRLPHQSQVYVMETTMANPIHLDGKVSGWCKVEHNGVQGWILDRYLNK